MRRTLDRLERASPDEVVEYQERRLRLLVRWAALRSPFYRRWFADSGIDPRSVRTLADLTCLPLLDRDGLIEDAAHFRAYPARALWPARSSGTTGSVVTVYRTPGASAFELSALERQWGWFGLPRGARRVVMRGAGYADAGASLSRRIPGANQLVVSSYRLTSGDLDALEAEIRAFEPHAVEGWPSSIALLGNLLKEQGRELPVRAVITSSEVMTEQQLRLMAEVFHGPVVDHYGQTERVTMAGGCEHGGYHLFPDYAITELLPVEGEPGRREIVGTPLHNWGFPLFRYRTGDTVGPAAAEPCPCGRPFPLLGKIDGRAEDSFIAADGRTLPLPSTVLDSLVGLREVQIAQLAQGRFEVRLVPGPDCDLEAVKRAAGASVEHYFGPGQTVTFRELSRIPRSSSGKLRNSVVEGRSA